MNEIYIKISELTPKFTKMCYGITQNKTEIKDAVQELMLYFLQMNPSILKRIYTKDGEKGIIKYGAVVLRRSLTSVRSPFYYKYKKYYTHLDKQATSITYDLIEEGTLKNPKNLYNIPNPEAEYKWDQIELIEAELEKMYWYDKKIFELYYYEANTLDSLAKKTGISRNSLFSTIDKVRTVLKETLNE
ncbi:MAG: hypothetical protein Unbinned579contig1003_15 [Prokaryotic dsDNA virus sp.]|nr:MAG: hypothetical protein Unbinned579contig1003_15 [Prokaryotic dsDNA virus sp.]|tara:strand:+ start:17569 stop:18132 length:564 start_codon:yes stop_codon:yes gene_type:complete